MEPKPELQISGYRGIWGKDLNEQIAFHYALAFSKLIKSNKGRKVLLGRDARKSGAQILRMAKSALQKEGLEIVDAGIIPTPSIILLVKKLGCDGGIMITASHNPPEYNGIKFVMGSGLFSTKEENEEIKRNLKNLSPDEKNLNHEDEEINAPQLNNEAFRKIHIDEVVKHLDVDLIRSKKFKVAHDPINSAGSIITKELLEILGCQVFQINKEQDGEFAHMPEPLAKNLTQISELAKENKVDVGFAQDPDADRLVVVDEKGKVLLEEYTLALAIKSVLSQKDAPKGDVVINMSTSRVSQDVAESYDRVVHLSIIGEPNVMRLIEDKKAVIGGEGNGGVIYPTINKARDSLVGIGLILELMARENTSQNKSIGDIASSLPKYFMKKEKIPITRDLPLMYGKLKKQFVGASVTELDGTRFDWADSSWIHIRPSNTEPIIRIFGEAKTENRIDSLFEQARLTLASS